MAGDMWLDHKNFQKQVFVPKKDKIDEILTYLVQPRIDVIQPSPDYIRSEPEIASNLAKVRETRGGAQGSWGPRFLVSVQ